MEPRLVLSGETVKTCLKIPNSDLLILQTTNCVNVINTETLKNEMVLIDSQWDKQLPVLYCQVMQALVFITASRQSLLVHKMISGNGALPFRQKAKRYTLDTKVR